MACKRRRVEKVKAPRDEVVEGDGSKQEADIDGVPPPVEEQRGQGQPGDGETAAPAPEGEETGKGDGKEEEDETIRVKQHPMAS